jgi:periplasmic copper chaperone A
LAVLPPQAAKIVFRLTFSPPAMFNRLIPIPLLFLCAFHAAQAAPNTVRIRDASIRATAAGQDSALLSLKITSPRAARLLSVSSPVAAHVEIHSMQHDNGMMKMRELSELVLPEKQEVSLGSGGTHLMLMELKRPLKAGERIPLQLTLQIGQEKPQILPAQARVTPLTLNHAEHEHSH